MSAEKPAPAPPLPLRRPPGYRNPSTQIHHHYPPPSLLHAKRRRLCCRVCFCCFCALIAVLILAAASAALTFYLWFQPRLPEFHLKSIEFTEFNVTTTADGPAVDAASTVAVEIKNPNQNLGVFYQMTRVLLSAVNGDVSLGEQTVAGFSQAKGSATAVKLAMKVEREIVDGRCAGELKKGLRSKNLVVNVEMKSGIGVKPRQWATSPVEVEVVCDGVRLSVLERERGGGGGFMPKCRIKVFNWVFIN